MASPPAPASTATPANAAPSTETGADGTRSGDASADGTGSGEARCRNCGARRVGPYCHRCGQEAARRSLRALVGAFVREALDADGRLLRSVRLLLGKPGLLTALYVRGKRVRFTSPLRLYLLASLVFFGAFQLTHAPRYAYLEAQGQVDPAEQAERAEQMRVPDAPPDGASWSMRLQQRLRRGRVVQMTQPLAFTARFAGALSTALLLALPFLSLVLKLLVRRRPLYDHVVFALHFGAVFLLVFLAFMMLGVLLKAGLLARPDLLRRVPDVSPPLYGAMGLVLVAYLAGALRRAYRLSTGAAVWRTLVVAAAACAIYLGCTIAAHVATLYRLGAPG